MPDWEKLAVRAMGAVDTTLTVISTTQVSPTYLRVTVSDGGLLAAHPLHPTMWLRLWFTDEAGATHQRAFTLVDPDPASGTFSLEFALHEGTASRWAQNCRPGDVIGASLLGSKQPWEPSKAAARRAAKASARASGLLIPDQPGCPTSLALSEEFHGNTVVVGDPAALPAVNSILSTIPAQRASVFLEHRAQEDHRLPVRASAQHDVRWLHREDETSCIAAQLTQLWTQRPPGAQDRYWIAVEASATRDLVKTLRQEHGISRDQICATAYWKAA